MMVCRLNSCFIKYSQDLIVVPDTPSYDKGVLNHTKKKLNTELGLQDNKNSNFPY